MANPPSNIGASLLIPGQFWSPAQFTFSLPTTGSTFAYTDEPNATGYKGLTAQQSARFIAAIQAWDRLIAPNFTQTDDVSAPGNIRIAFTDYSEILDNWGYAFGPAFNGGTASARSGDIWINSKYANSTFAEGSYDFSSMMHEIGHAIGLRHPHDTPGFPSEWDNSVYSLMSYKDDYGFISWNFSVTGSTINALPSQVFHSTPMVLDIQAIQQRYGADMTTATGNDTYTFDQNKPFMMAIYDAGGNDTIDVSNHTRSSIIDLTPGAYSSIAQYSVQQQIAFWQSQYPGASATFLSNVLNDPDTYIGKDNLGIAFSTTIENAIGGSAGDTLIGNAVANILEGRGGNDTLLGGGGDDNMTGGTGVDILRGGAGWDRANFSYALSQGGVVSYGGGMFVGGLGDIDFIDADVEFFSFADGVIDRRDADIGIDDFYYYGANLDIWNARVDADGHYKTSGWREGRNPNQWFDTTAYLAAYSDARDAAAQGMDPLTHYLTIGWKKNYDPSIRFDTSQYLSNYTDVAAAGLNPLLHFLASGAAENRWAFNDGTMAS